MTLFRVVDYNITKYRRLSRWT